ncbi:MAG: endo-1,4-beta-xylanase [Puniceicoccaceae bacterium]
MKQLLLFSTALATHLTLAAAEDFPFFDGTDAKTDALMQQAEAQIEQVRKGDFTLELVDKNGKPVKGKVELELLSHEFQFGTDLFGLHQIPDSDPGKKTAMQAIDELFNSVIVCDYWTRNQNKLNGPHDWKSPDYGFKVAEKMGKRARFHALIFGFPRWLHHFKTEEEQWEVLERRIKQVADRYGDKIVEVDVINEFINYQYWNENPHAKYLKTTTFPNFAKPENGARILRIARKHMPNAKLVVLESNIWSVSNPVFQEIFEYHKRLIELDAPYDYIGYQAHYYAQGNMPFQKGTAKFGPRTFMMDEINKGLEQIATLGKPMVITEFNPPSRSNKVNRPNQVRISDEEIAAWESNFYTLLFSKPYIDGLSRWFTIDNLGGRGMDAGVVTEDGKLKPNYFALKTLIKDKWHTQVDGKLKNGKIEFNGFYGTYLLKVDGKKPVRVQLDPNNTSQSIQLP